MANDRIFIRCTTCNERILLTKHYPSLDLGQLHHDPQTIATWLSSHLEHHPDNLDYAWFLSSPGLVFELGGEARALGGPETK